MPLPTQPLDREHQISSPCTQLKPGLVCTLISRHLPGRTDPNPQIGAHPDQQPRLPNLKPQGVRTLISSQAAWTHRPKLGFSAQPGQWPGCPQVTTPETSRTEHFSPSPCAQSPSGPTRSLGGRQNAQQRGAAGLGETAVPRKTRLSRGLNYPDGALRDPSI